MSLTSVELFAGAGGLAMGVALAGFKSRGIVEWDRWACDTVRQNQERGHPLVADWPLYEGKFRFLLGSDEFNPWSTVAQVMKVSTTHTFVP
mgnify:CR=1 FL=1